MYMSIVIIWAIPSNLLFQLPPKTSESTTSNGQLRFLGTTLEEYLAYLNDDNDWPLAFIGLGKFGVRAKSAVPKILLRMATIRGRDPHLIVSAATTLGEIGPDAEEAIPWLLMQLRSTEIEVRVAATISIGKLGLVASCCSTELRKHVNDINETIATESLISLAKVTLDLKPSDNSAIVQMFKNSNRKIKQKLVSVFRVRSDEFESTLTTLANNEDVKVRVIVAQTLRRNNCSNKRLTSLVLRFAQDSEPEVRAMAAECLGTMTGSPNVALPWLRFVLAGDPDFNVRYVVSTGLANFALQDLKVIPQLFYLATFDPHPTVRYGAVNGLRECKRVWLDAFTKIP